ncbi:hypothetical protein BC834DRAFT_586713 [Gloeopeniophorella convolvens]|nr:hypothetical protein BC834DRAFT_586713 [Gloeopeniophorella convolvens]
MACHMMETKREETRTACRNWLSPPDPSVNHNAKRKLRFTGTTEWFIHGNFFGEWKSNDGSFMWLHGKPGSGKSILCSAIVDYCVQHLRQVGLGIVVYFYCDLQDSAKQTRDSILRSMLVQLSEQSDSYSETLSHFYSELDGRQPCDEELVQCLKSMLERPDEAAKYIIVDALDECPDAGLRSPRKEILRLLEGLAGSHFPNVHVCVTSRPESNIAQALAPLASSSICLQEQPGHARAIIDFLRRSVDTHDEMRNWSSQVKDMVVDALANSAHGMFQFVSCHLDETCGLQPAAIQQNLEGLPKALCESYKLTLRRINEGNWQSAHRIFQRLSLMGRPLSVGELADVLAVDFDEKPPIYRPEWRPEDPEKAVLSTCPGSLLCVVDGASPTERIVQFAHPSVRDFLTSDIISQSPEHISRFRILPAPSDAALLESCLSTLVRIDEAVDEDIKDATDDDGDRDGATDGGVQPATRGQDTGPPRLLLDDSAGPSALGRGISAALRAVVSDIAGLSVLQAVLNGSSATSRSTSRDGQAAALQAASSQGDANAIQFLLSHGTDPNAQGSEGGTALQAAASRGHAEVVQLLLNYGADPNVLGGRHGSALHAAIHRASPPLVIIRLLIFHGADINALDGERATPLQVASYLDRVDVVRLLLECGADVGAQGGRHGGTALQAATDRGHTEVARLLCEFSQDQPAVSDSI